ncbi:MAG: hypothetical protein ACRECX_07605 [Methyloceanibacter sp.]|uniref:hypothetical protein n=1 Tax=Methyloceanibacter sp. TaxID=1965321 RepID=UPI003D6CD4E5
MRPVGITIALMLAAVWLAGCGWRSSSGGTATVATDESVGALPAPRSRMAIASAKPVDAYVMLGGRVKTCWFNPSDPLFPEHVYRADVSPDGSKVKITIHEAQKLGRAGKTTYAIDFHQEGAYTVVTTENRGMMPEQAAKMQYDIDRWKRGEVNCSKEMPKVAAQPAAQ